MSDQKSTSLAVAGGGMALGVHVRSMGEAWEMAQTLARAQGFVPDSYVNKPNAIMAAICMGAELGLPPMTSLREIHVIKGKPSLSATMMLALARRAGIRTRWLHTDATRATIGVTVPGVPEQALTFAEADARAAGVWGQGNWKTYPAAMLRARATSAAIRAFCPEVLGGSVYESDSGEISDGLPPAQIIDAEVSETPPPAERRKVERFEDCESQAELLALAHERREKFAAARNGTREKAIAKLREHAERLGVDVFAAMEAAGLAQTPHDPETGEVV